MNIFITILIILLAARLLLFILDKLGSKSGTGGAISDDTYNRIKNS